MVKLPATVRVMIGLIIVLAHVGVQPGKALSVVLCTELDGRTIVEFGTHGVCQHPVRAGEVAVIATAESYCTGCEDRVLSPDPSPVVAGKRGEAPRSILPTGPPSQDVALPRSPMYPVAVADACMGCLNGVFRVFRDPFLVALRTNRLLT